MVDTDEQPLTRRGPEKIPQLQVPPSRSDGTITAANSSSISDGGVGAGADHRGRSGEVAA
jgi:acetyl-CoA C-acetyltransferase